MSAGLRQPSGSARSGNFGKKLEICIAVALSGCLLARSLVCHLAYHPLNTPVMNCWHAAASPTSTSISSPQWTKAKNQSDMMHDAVRFLSSARPAHALQQRQKPIRKLQHRTGLRSFSCCAVASDVRALS